MSAMDDLPSVVAEAIAGRLNDMFLISSRMDCPPFEGHDYRVVHTNDKGVRFICDMSAPPERRCWTKRAFVPGHIHGEEFLAVFDELKELAV